MTKVFVINDSDVVYLNAIKQELQKENGFTALQKIEFVSIGGENRIGKAFNYVDALIKFDKNKGVCLLLTPKFKAKSIVKKEVKAKKQELYKRLIFIDVPKQHLDKVKKFKPECLQLEIEHLVFEELFKNSNLMLERNDSLLGLFQGGDDYRFKILEDFNKLHEYLDMNRDELFSHISNFTELSHLLNPKIKLDKDAHNKAVSKIQQSMFSYKIKQKYRLRFAKDVVKQDGFFIKYREEFLPIFNNILIKLLGD